MGRYADPLSFLSNPSKYFSPIHLVYHVALMHFLHDDFYTRRRGEGYENHFENEVGAIYEEMLFVEDGRNCAGVVRTCRTNLDGRPAAGDGSGLTYAGSVREGPAGFRRHCWRRQKFGEGSYSRCDGDRGKG